MANVAERIPVDDAYLLAVGRATYNFAYLEWGIVWLVEAIEPGFLGKAETLTANKISKELMKVLKNFDQHDPAMLKLNELASSFVSLVKLRDMLMHGNPITADGGAQKLHYQGRHGVKDWSIPEILEFANKTAEASISAGELLHGGMLAAYKKCCG